MPSLGLNIGLLNKLLSSSGISSPAGTSFNFKETETLSSEWTYTGNSGVGTYRDSSGTLIQSTNNSPRFDHDTAGAPLGLLLEETRTTKQTGANFNPVDTTAFTVVSGTGAITLVDKSTELAAAGLDGICTNGDVYCLASTGGNSYRVHINGSVGNTNAHSMGMYIAYSDTFYHGTVKFEGGSQILMQDSTAGFGDFRYISIENETPSATSREIEFNIQNGKEVYVILFNLQEGAFMTSLIANTGGGTATRNRDAISDLSAASRDYFNDAEGTIIANASFLEDENMTEGYVFSASNGTGFTNTIALRNLGTRSKMVGRFYGGSTQELNIDLGGMSKNRRLPMAASWKNGGSVRGIIGAGRYTEEVLANDITGMDRIYLGGRAFVQDFNGHLQDITFYPTELTVAQAGAQMIKTGNRTIIAGGQSNMAGYESQQNDGTNGGQRALLDTYDSFKISTENFIANGATNGSKLIKDGLNDDWWYDPATTSFGPSYDYWANVAAACANSTSDAIIWDQGESDVGESKADYKAALKIVFDQMRTVVGNIPVVIVPMGGRTDSQQTGYQIIREAQQELAAENAYIHLAPEKFDNELELSGTHLTDDGYISNAPRVIRKVMSVAGETVAGGVDGPIITGHTRSGATVTVTISHDGGTDFTPTSDINGFVFFDDATEINISSAVRTNATTITLTLASLPTGVETIYYGYGALFGDDLTKLVRDNDSNGALPLRSYTG